MTTERPTARAPLGPRSDSKRDGVGRVVGLLAGALLATGALASCDRAESHRVAADAQDAARQTAAGLDHAAAQAQPAADRAARDAKRGVNDLAIAAGKATRKAGAQLEHAGERAQQGSPAQAPSGSN
jgi:hypothetical protein